MTDPKPPITADDVLRTLDELTGEGAGAQEPDTPEPAPVAPEPQAPAPTAPAPTPEPAKPKPVAPAAGKPSAAEVTLALAWDLAMDAVRAKCPDLDEEVLNMARDAAGDSPLKFKQVAEKLQEKIARAKSGAPVNSRDALAAGLVRRVFSGAQPGGDAAVAPAAASPTAAEALAEAVKNPGKGDVMGAFVKVLNEEGLLGKSVRIE